MRDEKYDICIIGAGIVGMATAFFLNHSNLKICVVDKCEDVAKVSSEVNGGQLNPTRVDHTHMYIDPAKTPLWTKIKITLLYPKWTFDYLYYRYQLLKFPPLSAKMTKDIKMAANDTLTCMKEMKWDGLKMGKRATLPDITDPLAKNAIFMTDNYNIGTGSSYDLAHLFKKKCQNIDFFFNHTFISFKHNHGYVTEIITDKKKIVADKYILATGLGLSKWLSIMPVYGLIRTYPFPHKNLFHTPGIILASMPSRHAYMNIIGNTLRLGGGDLICPYKPNVNAFHLPQWDNHKPTREWIGHRPVSPDGVPYIGKLPYYKNVYVNGGHGFWGWTLSLGTAKILSEHILFGKPIPSSFCPYRFKMIGKR